MIGVIGDSGWRRAEDLRAASKEPAMWPVFALELFWPLAEGRVLELDFQPEPAFAGPGRNWRVWQPGGMDAAEQW